MKVRLNSQGREIWFERVLWSWIPCHWKGWAAIAGVVVGGLASLALLTWIAAAMSHPDANWPFLVIVPFVGLGWWLAERHSPSDQVAASRSELLGPGSPRSTSTPSGMTKVWERDRS